MPLKTVNEGMLSDQWIEGCGCLIQTCYEYEWNESAMRNGYRRGRKSLCTCSSSNPHTGIAIQWR